MNNRFHVMVLKPTDPRKILEHTLWVLVKDTRRAEARTRMVPLLLKPELRFYVSRADGELHLLYSRVLDDGRAVGDMAEQKKREFEARGWMSMPSEVQTSAATRFT